MTFRVERFIGQGIVLDFSDKGDIYEITREDIMAHADELKKVDFAILNTGGQSITELGISSAILIFQGMRHWHW